MLLVSNIFMTTAWYWHLKFNHLPIWAFVLVSWGIALIEYAIAVPANRIGYQYFSAADLKAIQECLAIAVFVGFAFFFLGEKITLQHLAGFAVMGIGAWLVIAAGGR